MGFNGKSNAHSFTFQALISTAKQNRSVQNICKRFINYITNRLSHKKCIPNQQFKIKSNQVWTHQVNYRYTSRIIDICTSKFQYGSSSYIFASMADNTIHCLHRDTLKRVWTQFHVKLAHFQSIIQLHTYYPLFLHIIPIFYSICRTLNAHIANECFAHVCVAQWKRPRIETNKNRQHHCCARHYMDGSLVVGNRCRRSIVRLSRFISTSRTSTSRRSIIHQLFHLIARVLFGWGLRSARRISYTTCTAARHNYWSIDGEFYAATAFRATIFLRQFLCNENEFVPFVGIGYSKSTWSNMLPDVAFDFNRIQKSAETIGIIKPWQRTCRKFSK